MLIKKITWRLSGGAFSIVGSSSGAPRGRTGEKAKDLPGGIISIPLISSSRAKSISIWHQLGTNRKDFKNGQNR